MQRNKWIPGRFCVWKKDGMLYFDGDLGYETRRSSVQDLIQAGDELFPAPDFPVTWIWSNDRPETCPTSTDLFFASPATDDPHASNQLNKRPNLAPWVSFQDVRKGIRLVPDFVFGNWPQVGIDDFDQTCLEMTKRGQSPALKDQCGWIGNATLTPIRMRLVELGSIYPSDLEIVNTGTWKPSPNKFQTRLNVGQNQFKSLPDLVSEYSMLIDVEGYGWSGRKKLLFHSNRPLLIQERPWKEFYFHGLSPWVHYIPVNRNLDNLVQQIQWVRNHRHEADTIAFNALQFAQIHLTRYAAVMRWGLQLSTLAYDRPASRFTPSSPTTDDQRLSTGLAAQYQLIWKRTILRLFCTVLVIYSRFLF